MVGDSSNSDPVLLTPAAWECLARRLSLSPREVQIARAVLDDLKEAAIARCLGISSHTVHTHLERMYRKLGVVSRLALVVHLVRCHLESIEDPQSSLPPVCSRRAAGRCPFTD